MVFIDTNALYYAVGISENENVDIDKLRTYISNEDIVMSSVSVFEFIMKYKDDIETIHRMGRYLGDRG